MGSKLVAFPYSIQQRLATEAEPTWEWEAVGGSAGRDRGKDRMGDEEGDGKRGSARGSCGNTRARRVIGGEREREMTREGEEMAENERPRGWRFITRVDSGMGDGDGQWLSENPRQHRPLWSRANDNAQKWAGELQFHQPPL
ncbi:uncharacterized protein BO96DRAFT_439876 [Aspergillus niger CBS 101883]|uniref:uncharacterized protein n=1 Tax=Aspergillus lacticoffeatus (strain CBS 101883) TaxID=1450533 RepID=UPI000D80150F|nr:uncharacterized protein BO96DRAFT_439876 [Aspergillus niger CBS 101883]PYH50523.1 hypothetical protein BO96DRAFT_439876 [Aspergillus niger CBS 101883]